MTKNNLEKIYVKAVEGPFEEVLEDWIDYNGHMNVAYYTLAFDHTIDFFLEKILGIGPTHVKEKKQGPYSLQANYNYLQELRLGDKFNSRIFILDADRKRIHLVLEMINFSNKEKVAVCETILINVDLTLRRSTEYPDWAQRKIFEYKKACEEFIFPKEVGKPISLKKSDQG